MNMFPTLKYFFLSLLIVVALDSCKSTKKSSTTTRKSTPVRTGPKGWYKNTNNPHNPNTTNPGHTKKKTTPTVVPGKNKTKTAPAKGNSGKGKGKGKG